jgi:hypothetical protein
MADQNLTIGIRADSSQLRADLALVNVQLSELGRQMRAAAKDAFATGDRSGLLPIAGQFEAASAHAKNLKAEIAAGSAEAATFSGRLKEGAQGLEQIAGQFRGGIGGAFGGGANGAALGVAAVVAALGELYHLASSAGEHAHEITLLSSALGVSTGQVREWTKAAAEAGVEQDLFAKYLERVAIKADEASKALHKEVLESAKLVVPDFTGGSSQPSQAQRVDIGMAPKLTDPMFRAFGQQIQDDLRTANDAVVKGGGVATPLLPLDMALRNLSNRMVGTGKDADTLREKFAKFGGAAPAKSLAEALGRQDPGFQDAFTKVGAAVDDFSGKMLSADKVLLNVHNALKDMSAPDTLKFQKDVGGRTAIDPALTDFIKSPAFGDALNAAPSADAALASLDELYKKQISIKAGAEELKLTGAAAVADFGKSFVGAADDTKDLVTEIGKIDEERFDNVTEGLKGLADLAKSVASSIADVISSSAKMPGPSAFPSGDIGSSAGPGGFAMGGLIRGPGTGTSDSIFARVSNGEFIVPAAPASANLGLLRAISNGFNAPRFALGGLVDALSNIMPAGPSFASGGLVTAGGGTTHVLNLTIGDQHFDGLIAPATVANKLAQYARQENLLSAGRRPSSIGGR